LLAVVVAVATDQDSTLAVVVAARVVCVAR
jgi:hypothetical protein